VSAPGLLFLLQLSSPDLLSDYPVWQFAPQVTGVFELMKKTAAPASLFGFAAQLVPGKRPESYF